MDITIRTATARDEAAIADCVSRAYSHYIERIGKPPGPMLDDYAQVLQKHSVFVAQSTASIVGVLVLIESSDSILLDNVAVDPSAQGQGLGGRLITFAEDEACKRGYTDIELYTHEKMTENIPIYEKRGYAEIERKAVNGYKRIYMRKQLI